MRKIFVMLLAAAAVSLGGGEKQAQAAPCLVYPSVHNGVNDDNACLHWADTNRATPGSVGIYAFNVSGDWQAAITSRRTYFNSVNPHVKLGTTSIIYNTCIETNYWAFKHNLCVGAFNHACGPFPADAWAGCAFVYGSYNAGGSLTPHISMTRIKIKDPSNYTDGSTWILTNPDRNALICHEVLGHGYGMTHTTSPADPAPADSCLYYAMQSPTGPLVLGNTVDQQIIGAHNHNDNAGEAAGIGTRGPLSPKARKLLSVLKLKRVKGEGPEGQPVYLVPGKPNEYDVRRLPKGPLYVGLAAVEAFESPAKPLWQQFRP